MSLQSIKNYLVRRGPDDPLVHSALKVKARVSGFKVRFFDDRIAIERGRRRIILHKAEYVQVPITMECFHQFFDSVCGVEKNGVTELDFSQPGVHRYRRSDVALHFPSIPEEDSMDAYSHWYRPQPGDVVWDAGAHAGATSYFLSQWVGLTGRVYAFEPDEKNYEFLLKNIELHKLANVVPVKKALAGKSGTMDFIMDGTMSAGLSDYLRYVDETTVKTVPTVSFVDACDEFGCVPKYVKMDIEGAEVAVVESAADFLRAHPVHFAIESYHWNGDKLTRDLLDPFFPTIGYAVESSDRFGQMFTWAKPPA
ncbi:MAG TPA: FkbM family methyltransferase [Candidatus Koribacter sp.]|jgi:FkbM family methyltransferase